ncbi:MAG: GHKL domain-containing protein [Clostridiales bacterium]|nr:GHKL domain-containing protein [Clostridiales bacterium]
MDLFSLGLDVFCLTGQSLMHILFVGRLTGRRQKIWRFAVYLLLIGITERLFSRLAPAGILPIGAQLLILYGMNRFAMGNRPYASCTASLLAIYISQLSFGIINSAEALLLPHWIGNPLLYPMLLLATLAAFAVCASCYAAVLKFLSLTEDYQTPYIGLLLFPGLFFFAAELYILRTSYSVLPVGLSLAQAGKHIALLFLQALGLGALLCTVYAYRRICHGFQTQAALASLTQAAQAQKVYIREAETRYEQTKAFRHDIKNHLSVLSGLLHTGNLDESKAYLQKLETASAALSLPYQTGNPVADVLLGEKLGLAKAHGITAEVSVVLPKSCGIDDFDLCVIFANALDNAIQACQLAAETKSIHIVGQQQGDFFMLGFENTCSAEPLPPIGIGLSNIKRAAEKYGGAISTEKTDRYFRLHVLLNISLPPERISAQKP